MSKRLLIQAAREYDEASARNSLMCDFPVFCLTVDGSPDYWVDVPCYWGFKALHNYVLAYAPQEAA